MREDGDTREREVIVGRAGIAIRTAEAVLVVDVIDRQQTRQGRAAAKHGRRHADAGGREDAGRFLRVIDELEPVAQRAVKPRAQVRRRGSGVVDDRRLGIPRQAALDRQEAREERHVRGAVDVDDHLARDRRASREHVTARGQCHARHAHRRSERDIERLDRRGLSEGQLQQRGQQDQDVTAHDGDSASSIAMPSRAATTRATARRSTRSSTPARSSRSIARSSGSGTRR